MSYAEQDLDRAATNMHRTDFVLCNRRPRARHYRRNKHWQRVYWKRLAILRAEWDHLYAPARLRP